MKKEVGLWIDHRQAILMTITDKGEEMTRIYSTIELDTQFSGRSRSAGSQVAGNIQDRKYTNGLERYYDDIIGYIQDADSILIFGPGEAKCELAERMKSKNLSQRIVSIETTDRLTDPQIAAKIRLYFPGQQCLKVKNESWYVIRLRLYWQIKRKLQKFIVVVYLFNYNKQEKNHDQRQEPKKGVQEKTAKNHEGKKAGKKGKEE